MRVQSQHSYDDRGLDAYFTPREATISLINIERERLPLTIREPACGNGAIVTVLRENNYIVRASDIHDYGFECQVTDYLSAMPDSWAIVTNPPFKLAIEFLNKALKETYYVALLLRTNFLESQDRLAFFRENPPARVWISSRRLPMMHRHNWTGPEAPNNTCHAWFIWDKDSSAKRELNWFDWADYPDPRRVLEI